MTEAQNKRGAKNPVHSTLLEPPSSFPGVPVAAGGDCVGATTAVLHLDVSSDWPQALAILKAEVMLLPKLSRSPGV